MAPPTLKRNTSTRYDPPSTFPQTLSYITPSASRSPTRHPDPYRRLLRGPGRRGSFERHMLEGLFIKAFCVSAFAAPKKHKHYNNSRRSWQAATTAVPATPPASAASNRSIVWPTSPAPSLATLSPQDEWLDGAEDIAVEEEQAFEDEEKQRAENEIVRKIRAPRWRGAIPREHLEVIGEEEKRRLFEGTIPVSEAKLEEAADVMGQLAKLSPRVAERFAMKAYSREALVFRLLFPQPRVRNRARTANGVDGVKGMKREKEYEDGRGDGGGGTRENGDGGGPGVVDGYYALSYRWQSHPESTNPRVANCKKYAVGIPPTKSIAIPVSDEMFEAIMEELPELDEGRYGLWCDQVCIDESNDEERNTAVGMMDSIYRAAAKVVIALDDVEIAVEEVAAMMEFSKWHDYHTENGRVPEDQDLYYMRDKPRLRSCVEKIVYSDYFDRAWCAHEFELASDRVVLVRTKELGENGQVKVIRIEDDKLHSLMLLLTLLDKQVITAEQATRRVNVELLASRDARDDPGVHSQRVHDMQTMALIVSMKAGGDPQLPEDRRPFSAIRDKMSIMLNASDMALVPAADLDIDCGSIEIANARIYQYVSLLMLAAGNPLVLTTTSRSIPADEEHESWLRKFWLLDAGIDADLPPLPRPLSIRVDPDPGCRWIELDMLFPTPASGGGFLHTASDKFMKHAHKFVTDFRTKNPEIIEPEGSDVTVSILEARREYVTHLIACILECRWTWGYGPLPAGMTTPSPTSPTTTRRMINKPRMKMKYSSEKPWEYFFGDGLDRIPESIVWDRSDKDEKEQKTAKDMAGELMSGLLMTAPLPETRGDTVAWRPAWFEVGVREQEEWYQSGDEARDISRCRYIAMVPRDGGPYRAAIPEVLKSKEYASLARCWVLEESGTDGDWVVRNRSKLIMETQSLEQEHKDRLWETKPKQKVWGRNREVLSDCEDV